MSVPTITAEGRLTAAPELRFVPSGKAVCNFTLATSSSKKNPDTHVWEDTDKCFLKVTCWGQMAENVCESLSQGDEVVVVGALSQREYTDREGAAKVAYQELRAFTVAAALNRATLTLKRAQRGSQGQQAASAGGAVPSDDPWQAAPTASDPQLPPFYHEERTWI